MKVLEGWLDNIRHCPSPNFNDRPPASEVSLLVIHNISLPPGEFGNGEIEKFFCNQLDCSKHSFYQEIEGVEVSAHFLIERNGDIVQFVAADKRAWHAGESVFEGCENCNDFSIGIELEGTDDTAYTEEQYFALRSLTRQLMQAYPAITKQRIVGHSDIAPGRKTDPGPAFSWPEYLEGL